MDQRANASRHPRQEAGADVGATLAKLAVRDGNGSLHFRLVPSQGIEQVAREVEELRATRIGLTGGGASQLAGRLNLDTVAVAEFEAWRVGAQALLLEQGEPPGERDLLVSLGTGTALVLLEGGAARWVGGTALGGGTLLGLATLLVGTSEFEQVVALAARGDRRRVDLLVGDIYGDGGAPLPADVNASSFAKIAGLGSAARPEAADLAQALMAMVGENVAGLCAAVAAATGAQRIVFGGSTLRRNAPLRGVLARLAGLGRPVVFLERGEFAGALGALLQLSAAGSGARGPAANP